MSEKAKLLDTEVIPISRKEFLEGASSPADVFVRVGNDHYVLVSKEGARTNFNELHVADREGLDFLYIRKSEFKKCVGQKLTIAGILVEKKELSDEKKAAFISSAMDQVFTEIEALGFNHESMEHARFVASNIKTLVESKTDLLTLVTVMAGIPGDLLRHSLAVSSVSVMLGRAMGWAMPGTLEKLALGGLLHDIGLKELPKEILEKPRHALSYDEQVIFETHAFRGVEILRSMPTISDDLISMVFEHHENAIGQGYPRRLRDYKINPLARVIALADSFCEITLPHVNNPHPKLTHDALIYMETTLGQPFSKPAFQALKLQVDKKKATPAAA